MSGVNWTRLLVVVSIVVSIVVAAAMLALVVATAADAQVVGTVGPSQDWIRLADGAGFQDLTTPLAGVGYDIVFADSSTGMTISGKWTDGDETLQEYALGYWSLAGGGVVEWFGDAIFETWGPELTGGREFLGGIRGGIRFPVIDSVPVELSGRYSMGGDGKAHAGVFLGLRQ